MYNTCIIPCSITCQNGYTPLHLAASQASVECVKELMQHADIAATLIMQDKVSNTLLVYLMIPSSHTLKLNITCVSYYFKMNYITYVT